MKWLFFILGIISCAVAGAQDAVVYTIRPGESVKAVIPSNEIYRYPAFTTGTVVFRDGTSSAGMLNYNALIGEMQFIDPKRDTMSVANEETIRYVLIANDTFYFKQGFIRLLKGYATTKVGVKVAFSEYVQKPGAYGLSSSTTATNNISALLDKRSVALEVSQELVLLKSTAYFIADKFNAFVPADRKNIFKMFPRKKQVIDEYLEKNNVDLKKEPDLVKLTEFLGGL
jgi:hypothetical protein